MNLYDIFNCITIQGDIKVCTYDYDNDNTRVWFKGNADSFIAPENIWDFDIKYIYQEDGYTVFEIAER